MALISNLKTPDDQSFGIRAGAIPFATVDSTSTATAFTATVPGITELADGTTVMLKNGVVTSTTNFTININGLGAKPCYTNLAAATRDTTIFNINYTMIFVYDSTRVSGGGWICYRGYDANTNTIGYQIRSNSFSLPMTSITYRYRLLFQSADNAHWVPATNSTSTNATSARTVCQDPINPFGSIVYYGTTASVAAGSRPSVSNLWQQYAFNLGYSFQESPNYSLTSWKPVYLKCAPQTNGSAIIDADVPFVQDLPTTEDGKIYIYLGVAYSTTNIELVIDHPVYCYKDGMVRLWTTAASSAAPVQSVNGQTGAVVLDAEDVGALPDDTVIPTKTSDLTNDSGFITASQAPVQSVNGQTGAVTVDTMPSATGEADGTALVVVDGVWTKQTGYGYKATETGELANYTLTTTAFEPAVIQNAFEPSIGSEYTVVYDGVTYTLTAIADTVQGYGDAIYFGNGQLFGLTGGDPNCPFVYGFILAMQAGGFVTATSGDHTIVINGDKVVRHNFTLDYVPIENVAGVVQHKGNTDYLGTIGSIKAQNGVSYGFNSTAFGEGISGGDDSFSEGRGSALGDYSHAEGYQTTANMNNAHTEGFQSIASGDSAHAEGFQTEAIGVASHSEGFWTIAKGHSQHAGGKYNIQDDNNAYAEIIGNGTNESSRSNARTLDWSGNEWVAGSMTAAGGFVGNVTGTASGNLKSGDNVSSLTNDSGFITSSQAPVQSVNGSTGAVTITVPTKTSDLTNDSGFVTSDTKVTQTVTTTTDYTYWRGLCVGSSSSQAETGSLSTTTDQVRIFSNIRVQPSTGTLKATIFKGQLSGTIASSTTATTQASTDNSTKVATTAFVKSVLPAELPSVSSSDNGKVLMVVNGAWAAASLPVYNGGVI